ncbi:sarcoplasmic calcium-binding proteins I, III, and IV-like [Limulus polyphemus]|uniref:Sarcoplasmic calcium-binding proteins I, III, and IV-like n=1 Tax=Limulus polyphemus TaxID=6850 RepID=A0ABM1BK13_LIMPO|nr:sarcoplasmic calcium-binding proteins I, III, and IV-like [Limulus polyphemus]XP_022251598.1 sarcoplasmic calcium-binding proteins I, III, and IV-like [Limulus polyphemus]
MSTLRHKHLYMFHKFWDVNGDGVLTWEDFRLLAEKYAKIQRRGKLEKDVFERWQSILEKWWNELTSYADYNKDTIVEFDEWLRFFDELGKATKCFKDLPDFLQLYLHLFFLVMDSNKDGLFCVKDYKKYLTNQNMDVNRAQECFQFMLNDEDRSNGNAMTSDRFKDLVYEYWVSSDANSQGKYICGPFDSAVMDELEKMVKKRQ